MNLIFATNNHHKVDEIRAVLPSPFHIITLKDAGIAIDIPEPYNTLQENAAEKARTIFNLTDTSCFSEDTGLEVFSLDGEPGVKSARYAGEEQSSEKNMEKLLSRLEGKTNRTAQFRTVVCLILNGEEYFFEGICKGRILDTPRGTQGFGYDPIFVPEGAEHSFAEMSLTEKNNFSHRRKAIDGLVSFLNSALDR